MSTLQNESGNARRTPSPAPPTAPLHRSTTVPSGGRWDTPPNNTRCPSSRLPRSPSSPRSPPPRVLQIPSHCPVCGAVCGLSTLWRPSGLWSGRYPSFPIAPRAVGLGGGAPRSEGVQGRPDRSGSNRRRWGNGSLWGRLCTECKMSVPLGVPGPCLEPQLRPEDTVITGHGQTRLPPETMITNDELCVVVVLGFCCVPSGGALPASYEPGKARAQGRPPSPNT